MQDRLARHFLPAEATIFGTVLERFSLWHWRTLSALGSPLLEGEDEPTFEDLALAVRICALPPNSSFRRIQRALKPGFLGRLRLAFYRRFDHLDDSLEVWFEYFAWHASGPRGLDNVESGFASTHPTVFLHAGLMQLGYSREDAWAESPGLARWFIAGALEAAGQQLAIVTDDMIRDARAAGYTEEQIGP